MCLFHFDIQSFPLDGFDFTDLLRYKKAIKHCTLLREETHNSLLHYEENNNHKMVASDLPAFMQNM